MNTSHLKTFRKATSIALALMLVLLCSVVALADGDFDLQTAIDEAENGATIVLPDDVLESVTIPEGKEITIDLNGCSITGDSSFYGAIYNKGILTIVGNGTVMDLSSSKYAVCNYTTASVLNIKGGTYVSRNTYAIYNEGEAVIEHATIRSTGSGGICNHGKLTLNTGTIVNAKEIGIYSDSTNTLNITGGTYSATSVYCGASQLTIDGGTFTSTGDCIKIQNGRDITINGGSFKSTGASIFVFSDLNTGITSISLADLTINGGRFEASKKISELVSSRTITPRTGNPYTQTINMTKNINGGTYKFGTDFGFSSVGSIICYNEIPSYVAYKGAKISITTGDTTIWYTGTEAINAIRNAEEGAAITVYGGSISTRTTHDVTITVNAGATVIINGEFIPEESVDYVIHCIDYVAINHECEDGVSGYYYCYGCGKFFEDPYGEIEIESIVSEESYTETCIAEDICYYRCNLCGKIFEDFECTVEIEDLDAFIEEHISYSHDVTLVPALDPTYESDGYEAYYICNNCNKMFADEECTQPIDAPVVIPKLVPVQTGWIKEDGVWHYYNEDGVKQSGWINIDGIYYYLDPENNDGMATGWLQIGSKWYHFKNDGAMTKGWYSAGSSWWYFDGSGAMATSWKKIDKKWYFFDRSSGVMMTGGWKKVDGIWYYFRDSGNIAVGWEQINGKYYYFNDNGEMQTGWIKDNNKWYYLNPQGDMKQNSWLNDSGNWYYFGDSGKMLTSTSITLNGLVYYFNSSGVCTNPSGDPVQQDGWVKVDGVYHYYENGAAVTRWKKDGTKWYYLDPDNGGAMWTGWLEEGGYTYYLDASGAMVANRTITIDGTEYTFDRSGHLK